MIVHMLKSRPLLWCTAGIALIVLTAGIGAGVAKGGLAGPGWLIAGATGAVLALAAISAALRPVVVKIVQSRVDRSIMRADATQELRERLGDAKGRFPRVSDIRERALLFGVQQAIPLDAGPIDGLSADLPRYLPRTIDGSLRSALTARSATGGMVILKGNSTWGKSRCMFEAVSQVLGDRFIVAPTKASDVHDLVQSGLPLKQYVLWLDELVDFLAADDPLTRHIVKRAVEKGLIIVGTIWKDDFAALTDPPRKALGNRADPLEHGPGTVDEFAEARSILLATYVDLIEMPGELDEKESAVAAALAKQDSRWAHALADAGELSPIQVLAAAPQLLQRYRTPDDEAGGAVLRTAVALLAMEHPHPLPVGLLRRVAEAAMPPTLESGSDRWFDSALAWACRPVRGTIAPLRAYRAGGGDGPGYVAPDLLVGTARDSGTLKDQVNLELTLTHATVEACAAIGTFFRYRDEGDVAEPFLRRAAESGVVRAYRQYAHVLGGQEGRAAEAEEWYRKAVDAGQTPAVFALGQLLSEQEGRAAEAEEWYRKAVDAGYTPAVFALGHLLSEQEGRAAEAEEWYRKALDAEADSAIPMLALGFLLSGQEGRAVEAEEWYRKAIDAGQAAAMLAFGHLLSEQEGRAAEAEEWYRKAIDAGFSSAAFGLGHLLCEQEGRAAEAEEWYRKAIDAGHKAALVSLGRLLGKQEGRAAEAEEWFLKAVDAGADGAMLALGRLLSGQEGRAVEAEEWYRKAMDAGDGGATVILGNLLSGQEGRAAEAEEWYRKAADAGISLAALGLGVLLSRQSGRAAEAEEWYRKAADAGHTAAAFGLGHLLSEQEGRAAEAEEWYRKAADAGSDIAMHGLGLLLSGQEGRAAEAEEWYRNAADAGDTDAMVILGNLLGGQEGRAAEAEEWYRKAADAGHLGALSNLGDELVQQGRYPEARSILERGIAAGDRYAMFTMGKLELLDGNRDAGRVWVRKAASLGVSEAREQLSEEFGEEPPPTEPIE